MSKEQNTKFRTSIGGQALIEGIMMQGPEKRAIVIRSPEGLVTKVEPNHSPKDKYPILGLPLIRGVVNFIQSLIRGMRDITYSAEFFPEDEGEPSKFDLWLEKKLGSEKMEQAVIYLAVVLGILMAVGLFILLPTFLVGLIRPAHDNYLLRSLLEGIVKIILFLAYLWACSRMKDIYRVFCYHGAEHKTIFCYEKGLPLTVENVRPQSRFHPRCGTSFLFIVVIISVLAGTLIHATNTLARIGLRLLLLPVVVAVSYECLKWAGRHDNLLSRILSWPGKQLQRLTTHEPDDSMIEVAIEALKAVIPDTPGSDIW